MSGSEKNFGTWFTSVSSHFVISEKKVRISNLLGLMQQMCGFCTFLGKVLRSSQCCQHSNNWFFSDFPFAKINFTWNLSAKKSSNFLSLSWQHWYDGVLLWKLFVVSHLKLWKVQGAKMGTKQAIKACQKCIRKQNLLWL